jgi:hypothetical protein
MKFHEKASTHVKEFTMKKFIKLDCGFEPMGATDLSDIVDEVLKTLGGVEKSKHKVLEERQLCTLGCIIERAKRVDGPVRFTDVMDCLKTSCGLKHRDYFYRYEEGLEDEKLVAPVRATRGKNLYMPTVRGIVIYNAVLTLGLMGTDPQAFVQHAIVMLGFLRLLLETRKDVFDKLLGEDENLGVFFTKTIEYTLSALSKGEDVNQTIAFLTKRVVTADGEEIRGFDMVEYLASVAVNLYLSCAREIIEYLNLNNFLKIGKVLEDLRNNEPGGSQG